MIPRALLLALGLALAGCGGGRTDRTTTPPKEGPDGFDGELSVELAEALVKAGAYDNALPMIQRALRKTPKDARLHYLLGVILRDRGVYAQAEEALVLATRLAPQLTPARAALGVLYDLQGQHQKARPFHQGAVDEAPTMARYHNNYGFSRYLAGDYAGAEAAYRQGLSIDPNAGILFQNLGFALAAQGKDEDALRMFRQAVSEQAARTNLALAHELRGDQGAARRMYQKVLQQSPSLKQAVANLEALDAKTPDPVPDSGPREER